MLPLGYKINLKIDKIINFAVFCCYGFNKYSVYGNIDLVPKQLITVKLST